MEIYEIGTKFKSNPKSNIYTIIGIHKKMYNDKNELSEVVYTCEHETTVGIGRMFKVLRPHSVIEKGVIIDE